VGSKDCPHTAAVETRELDRRVAVAISASIRSKASCSASGAAATAANSAAVVLAPAERTVYPDVASAARIAAIVAL
jgi:hypothetical protein